jgi:hypothetical protein
VGVVFNYCLEDSVWLYRESIIDLVIEFCFAEEVVFPYSIHHITFVKYTCSVGRQLNCSIIV